MDAVEWKVNRISVIEPLGEAFAKVKEILFSPFDMEKWFVIGFGAWLAQLGEGGGSFNGNFGGGNSSGGGEFNEFKRFLTENMALVIGVSVVVMLICIAIGVVLTWLRSRGKFMFLYCVANNDAQVKLPWHKYREHGNSLFLFKIVLGFASTVVILFFAGIVLLGLKVMGVFDGAFTPGGVVVIVIGGLILILFCLVLGFVKSFTDSFVVPIMYLKNCRCLEAWSEFLALLSPNKWNFILFFLFSIVIGMGVGALVFALVICTCCIACCFMIIPYLGTVLLLPVIMFVRAYSLCYLRQYGSAYDVFMVREDEMPVAENS